MGLNQGDTFEVSEKLSSLDNHIWIVISDPVKDSSRIVFVNLTTWKQGKDSTCIILSGAHHRITKASCIVYSGAKMQCLADLEALFSAGKIQHCGPITKALLNQILNGAAKHDDMPTGCQNALRQQGLI